MSWNCLLIFLCFNIFFLICKPGTSYSRYFFTVAARRCLLNCRGLTVLHPQSAVELCRPIQLYRFNDPRAGFTQIKSVSRDWGLRRCRSGGGVGGFISAVLRHTSPATACSVPAPTFTLASWAVEPSVPCYYLHLHLAIHIPPTVHHLHLFLLFFNK